MKIYYSLMISFIMVLGFSSCQKNDSFDPIVQTQQDVVQAQKDDAVIVKFLADNKITALKHSSGIYYQIIEPGSGNFNYKSSTYVTVNYTGRLLSGAVFDKSNTAFSSQLGPLVMGWRIGVPLIQKGGKIRLFIPSEYGYGRLGSGPIPANAVLDFDIELLDVKN